MSELSDCKKQRWVNGWGLGVTHPPLTETQWTKNMTVRYVLINTLDAAAVRLSFTNRFGTQTAILSRVTVAKSADGKSAVQAGTVTAVTFDGNESGTMPPYGELISDEIPFTIKAGEKLAVSMYFADFTQMNTGFTYTNNFMVRRFIEGDHAADTNFDPMRMSFSAAYHFLWSVDFLASEDSYSVAAYGDSITSQEWVDIAAIKLAKTGDGKRAIVRRAVSGSRIFGSYPALSYFHYGEDGNDRFEREVIHAGVKSVIILHGINDIIHPDGKNPLRPMSNLPSSQNLADGLSHYIEIARNNGLKVYLATLLPIEGWRTYDIPRDNIRIELNEWIRTQTLADGVIDFERAVRDEKHPRAFLPECNSGDNLHPSLTGYERMVGVLDPDIFR